MVYPIVCIIPDNRSYFFQNCVLCAISDIKLHQHNCISCNEDESSSSCHDIVSYGGDSFSRDPLDTVGAVSDIDREVEPVYLNSQEVRIRVYDEELGAHYLGLDDIGILFGFTYISRLICLHESDLRNYQNWGLDSESFSCLENIHKTFDCDRTIGIERRKTAEETLNVSGIEATAGIIDMLIAGGLHSDLFIKFIPDVGNIKIGYGLFTNETIDINTPLGEYVGILLTSMPEPSSYSLNYPCSDGNHEINATEYGNITRFINHSNNANCSFKHVLFEGIVHVICVSFTRVISATYLYQSILFLMFAVRRIYTVELCSFIFYLYF